MKMGSTGSEVLVFTWIQNITPPFLHALIIRATLSDTIFTLIIQHQDIMNILLILLKIVFGYLQAQA